MGKKQKYIIRADPAGVFYGKIALPEHPEEITENDETRIETVE